MLISRLQAGLGAAILIVATAAVSVIVASKWNPFPPTDYEDCAARAAKDAKTKDALSVLLSICGSEFAGRRKPGGGYTYYDSCQKSLVDIKSNPTPTELSAIKQQCMAYIEAQEKIEAEQERRAAELAEQQRSAQQAAREARDRQLQSAQEVRAAAEEQRQLRKVRAMTAIRVNPSGFTRSFPYISDELLDMKVEVTNGSNEAVSSVSIGVAFVVANNACPSSYAEKHILHVEVSPGESRTDAVQLRDAALAKRHVCITVVDVEFAGAVSNPYR